jgi:hypothetical protein
LIHDELVSALRDGMANKMDYDALRERVIKNAWGLAKNDAGNAR